MPDSSDQCPSSSSNRYKRFVMGLAATTMLCLGGILRHALPVLFDEIAGDLKLSMAQIGAVWGVMTGIALATMIIIYRKGLLRLTEPRKKG